MPMTVVINLPSGQVQQLQVGAADIVATVAAAHSAWGWVGGLSGISSVLRLCQRKNESTQITQLFNCMSLDPPSCHVLCQNGLQKMSIVDNGEAFGDILASKLIGTTLCALAYNVGGRTAVRYLAKFFIDRLFGKGLSAYPGSKETIVAFLYDKYPTILSQGTIHQLEAGFDAAVGALGVSPGLKASNDPRFKDDPLALHSESLFIEGFFRWLFIIDSGLPYYTRSAAVGRIAVCLQHVGYKIGDVVTWNGSVRRPSPSRGVVLVTGGSSKTDEFMHHINSEHSSAELITHFHWNTVGAMLWNAFDMEFPQLHHETFQQDFDEIDSGITQSLKTFQWSHVDATMDEIQAFATWSGPQHQVSRIAKSLATVFFPVSVDYVAPYYEKISTEQYLHHVKSKKWGLADYNNIWESTPIMSRELQRFLVVTASICISVLGRVAAEDFANVRHSSVANIFETRHFRQLCHNVDAILDGGCGMSRIIRTVAAIHCGVDLRPLPDGDTKGEHLYSQSSSDSSLIGWRNGRYAVLPNLLFQLSAPLQPSVLGLKCTDCFIANLPVQKNGSVRSELGGPGAVLFSSQLLKPWQEEEMSRDLEMADSDEEATDPIVLGPPQLKPPDKPLYVSMERPAVATDEPELALCGRIDGESIGTVLIQEVLRTLALSWSDEEGYYYRICEPGAEHEIERDRKSAISAEVVYNMPASRYCRQIDTVPRAIPEKRNGMHCVYVQVAGDTPWTVFLAGQSQWHNCVAFGCADCAIHTGANCVARNVPLRTILGYQ